MGSSSSSSSSSGGIGFVGLLTIAFIVLKLMNVITWSWLWVLSPLWLGTVLIIVGVFLFAWIAVGRNNRRSKLRRRK